MPIKYATEILTKEITTIRNCVLKKFMIEIW